MKSLFLLPISILILSCSTPDQPPSEIPPLWGCLEPGEYSVGFTTQFISDVTRPPIPYSDWNGKLFPTTETEGRQMQINIWYPAANTPAMQRIRQEHYFSLFGKQINFSSSKEEATTFANEQLIEKTNALGGNGRFTQASLDSLAALETNAFLDADPVKSKFPLVLFPNGTSPAFQSIMCEYIASHGFVVAGMALKGQYSYSDEVSVRGIENAVMDLEFAVQAMMKYHQVDNSKLGLIGNAITSSQIVAFQTRNPGVDCIVSLEGGLLSNYEQSLLEQTSFYSVQAIDKPILAIYAPHPAIDPNHISHFKYSDRYFYHFPQMTEFHFLNFGPYDRFIPGIIGDHDGDVQTGYELGSQYLVKFLQAYLQDNSESSDFLSQAIPEGETLHIDTSFVWEGIPRLPDISVIKDAFFNHGFSYIDSLYYRQREIDDQPFDLSFYPAMRDWLAWKKDPDYSNRYRLYQLAVDSYPKSAEVAFYLAYYASRSGNEEHAFELAARAKQMLENDEDKDLTIDMKERLSAQLDELHNQ